MRVHSGGGIAAPIEQSDRALRQAGILGTSREERFDRIVRLAARLLDVPISMINLISSDGQWTKSAVGLPGEAADLSASICRTVVEEGTELEVPDLAADGRFERNPFVIDDPRARFYAGMPVTSGGAIVGTLCVLDTAPRALSADQRALLAELADWVSSELDNRALNDLVAALRNKEAEGRRQRGIIDSLLASTAEGVVGLGRDGRVRFVNPAALRLLASDERDLVGHVFHSVAHHSRPDGSPFPESQCPVHRAVTSAGSLVTEVVLWARDGTARPVEVSVAPLERSDEFAGSVLAIRDVSERKRNEELKRQFTAVVSHELRTPLSAIKASLGLLSSGVMGGFTEEQHRLLSIADSNASRLSLLVNDILDMERLDAGRMPLRPRHIDANDVARRVADALESSARAAGVVLEHRGEPGPVQADPDRLGQAITNLVGNAIKFSETGGTVSVECRVDGNEVRVAVRDEGRGIPRDQQEAVFERFRQVEVGDARRQAGTGLGLAISKGIVERSGGRIELNSAEGEGSEFTVVLPLHGPEGGSHDEEGAWAGQS